MLAAKIGSVQTIKFATPIQTPDVIRKHCINYVFHVRDADANPVLEMTAVFSCNSSLLQHLVAHFEIALSWRHP